MEYDLGFGDVHIWQEWYMDRDISIEAKVASLYQLEQPRDGQLENVIRLFHSHHGHTINAETKIVTGSGSTQVMLGLIYAFATCIDKMKIWEQTPCYSLHKNLVGLLGQEWMTSLTKQGTITQPNIEFVTSPNNPDGGIRTPISAAPIILWDAAYAWPWYGFTLMKLLAQMKKACSKRLCIPIFSFSKSLGLAGERVGYALIPPSVQKAFPSLLDSYTYYINTSTLGTCRPGEGVCRVIASGYREFPEITEKLENRYDALTDKLKRMIKGLEVHSPRGFAYLWIRLPGADLHTKLLSLGIRGLPGTDFSMSNEFVRLNLMASSNTLTKVLSIKE